jgi:hypothetical protein
MSPPFYGVAPWLRVRARARSDRRDARLRSRYARHRAKLASSNVLDPSRAPVCAVSDRAAGPRRCEPSGERRGEHRRWRPEETKTSTTSTTTSTSTSEPTNSHTVILLVVAAAIVLLSGIAFAIVRDARRVAPATEQEMIQGSSASETAARLRKRREKAKAARKQRKRNR